MKSYSKFLIKKLLFRKSNYIMLLFAFAFVFLFFILNLKESSAFSNMIDDQIKIEQKTIVSNENKMANLPKTSEDYTLMQQTVIYAKENSNAYKELHTLYEKKDWNSVYKKYLAILKQEKQAILNTSKVSGSKDASLKEVRNGINKTITYIRYLYEHHLAYENPDYPIFGLSFTTYISQTVLPIIIVLCCLYILTQIYTMDYTKDLDMSIVLPIRRQKVFLSKLLVGMGTTVFIYLAFLIFSFLLATICTHNSGLLQPTLIQSHHLDVWNAVQSVSLCKEWLLIGFLFYISLCIFTYLLSLFIREDIFLLFIVACIVMGFYLLPDFVGYVKGIAQLLPTTYMNYVNVTNGSIAIQYFNTHITYRMGILLLSGFCIVQLLCCVVYIRKAQG